MSPPAGKEPKVNELPPNFSFTRDDPFYFGPATCNLMHYTPAAYMAGFVEMVMLLGGSLWFWQLHSVNQSMDTWVVLCMFALTAGGLFTTALMFYGLKTEQARLIAPKLAFIQLEILILMIFAAVAIVAMSFGIGLTHQLFGVFIRIPEMERDFGPIWPFNIGVISFFAAALCIWMRVLISGAMEFILDKQFFTDAPSIEMEKTLPRPE
ncbi:hypothetical protein Y032_0189g1224 [Ancylostoma ceylanicum]|uniref:Uncharacterized protein n=1 Tax=Ancylostoma ceylanicum TaxID=53326 RepID=A0A016SRF7_9BILA|nr:hypothetical protein Y032_0189g1224 [Ancylostoma ceylanicum]